MVRGGTIVEGDTVTAAIDGVRRDRIRRNHTATHILHWALRKVLGPHVQQAGSLVAPDRLRFDFSHYEAVTPEQLIEIERLANAQIITDTPVRHFETTQGGGRALGAIAFFGEKYGDVVRVLDAGPSIELCGGTHVNSLGFIGPIKIVSEGSIGSNLRRIEAMTGDGALEYIEEEEELLRRAGDCCARNRRKFRRRSSGSSNRCAGCRTSCSDSRRRSRRGRGRPRAPGRAGCGRHAPRRTEPGELRTLAAETVVRWAAVSSVWSAAATARPRSRSR